MEPDTDIRVKTSLLALVYSGMRLDELCGLEWGDVDFKNEVIHIERVSQYVPGYGIITKEPKNSSSNRTVKLPGFLFSQLKEYKNWYDCNRLKVGSKWTGSNRLFVQWNGEAIYPATVGVWLKKFRQNMIWYISRLTAYGTLISRYKLWRVSRSVKSHREAVTAKQVPLQIFMLMQYKRPMKSPLV